MSRYDDQVLDEFQRPVPGMKIYVYDDAGQLDALTDDAAAPLVNPLTTDANGMFYFNAVDGEKTLDFRYGGRTRFKQAILVGPQPTGPQGPAGDVARADSRVAMAAIPAAAAGMARYLIEGGREGAFVFDASDLSSEVAADTLQGIYVAPSADATGTSGAWVRKVDGAARLEWFGGVADSNGTPGNGTDNSAALMAAHAALKARQLKGRIYLPAGRYRFASWPEFTESIVIEGDGWTENAGIVGAVSYPIPTNYEGTILVFDVDVPGPVFYANNKVANASTFAGLTDAQKYAYKGAKGSILRNLMLYGGGGNASAHGLEIRAVMTVDNVRVENFAGDGVRIDASAHTETTPWGIADGSFLRSISSRGNKRHGFRLRGNDANVIKIDGCDSALNGGCGYLDQGQLGNTYVNCHAATNNQAPVGATRTALEAEVPTLVDLNAGSYVTTSGIAAHLFSGCYTESGLGQKAHIIAPARVDGGNLAGDASLTTAATALVINGDGMAQRGFLRGINRVDAKKVGVNLGDSSGKIAFTFGSLEENADGLYRSYKLIYSNDLGDKCWSLEYSGSAFAVPILLPSSGSTFNVRGGASQYAPSFPNGFFLHAPGLGGNINWMGHGTVVPAAGAYVQGDYIHNRAPAAKGIVGWRRLTTGAAHVLGVDWQAEYGGQIGAQGAAVADAAALTSVDATNAVAAPTKAEFDAFVAEFNKLRTDLGSTRTALNTALARLRAHGLIAP